MVLVAALAMMLATAAPAMANDWDGNGFDDETGFAVFNDWNGDGFDDFTGLLIFVDSDADGIGDAFDSFPFGGGDFGFGDNFSFGGGDFGGNNNGGNNN